jgi:hypothetical protein
MLLEGNWKGLYAPPFPSSVPPSLSFSLPGRRQIPRRLARLFGQTQRFPEVFSPQPSLFPSLLLPLCLSLRQSIPCPHAPSHYPPLHALPRSVQTIINVPHRPCPSPLSLSLLLRIVSIPDVYSVTQKALTLPSSLFCSFFLSSLGLGLLAQSLTLSLFLSPHIGAKKCPCT